MYVIQWAGKIMESKIRTALTDKYYKPHFLVFKEEVVLFTKIISNEELQVTVNSSSNLTFHKLQWSQRLKVGKDKSSNKLTVALQGKLVDVNVQSDKNSSVVLEYVWMYEKLRGKNNWPGRNYVQWKTLGCRIPIIVLNKEFSYCKTN